MGIAQWTGLGALVLAAPLSAQQPVLPPTPGWMAGCWEMRDGERWAEECWTVARGGQMLGSGRTGAGTQVGSWEFMRIERATDGALTFSASPGGSDWTPFMAAADAGEGVTFVNPGNDFPQQVRYWREGDLLKARISQLDGSRAIEWTFKRMGG